MNQGRRFIEVVDLDLDKCQNTYGVSPCTAGRSDTGTAQSGTGTTIKLRAGASAVDSAYNNQVVHITGGTGSGQERIVSGYVGATKVATVSLAWTVNPDNTSTYSVIDRPNACYNTFGNCQDTTNFNKGTKTYRFCSRGTPIPAGETMRAYITGIKSAPTEVKPEDGLASRSTSNVVMADEPDSDVEQDPYVLNRAIPATGTFWTRLLARNYNYSGRFARIKRGYLTDAWDWGDFTTELYIIDSIRGPSGQSGVSVTLKDPTKLADRIKLPIATSGKLAVALGTGDLSMTLGTGDGTQYDSSGYVRVGDQIIRYTSNSGDVLSWPDSTYRSQFNTTAVAADIGTGVQLCQAWVDQPLTTVLQDILNASGIDDTYIDLAGFAIEETNWLGERYYVTACISEPEQGTDLLKELVTQSNASMWWSPTESLVRYKVMGPRSPTEVSQSTLTDAENFVEGTIIITSLDDLRLTFAAINYALDTATSNRDEAKSYLRAEINVDTDAEGANEYNDSRQSLEYSRWFTADNQQAMRTLVSRRIAYYRDAPKQIEFSLDPKDQAIQVGNLYDIETAQLVDNTGSAKTYRSLITKRDDSGKGRIKFTARTTIFDRRYAFISVAGSPDYLASTVAQQEYAFICNASGLMSNGDLGYLII